MRYSDGGGLTMEGRSRCEQVRLQRAVVVTTEIGNQVDVGTIGGRVWA